MFLKYLRKIPTHNLMTHYSSSYNHLKQVSNLNFQCILRQMATNVANGNKIELRKSCCHFNVIV